MSATACGPQDASSAHTGLAFGLVAAAGLSTTLGAGLAFVMPYSDGETNLFLAGSLAVAAGVMLYVSFVEIFSTKAVMALSACVDTRYAYLYASLCLFLGIFITWLFDRAVHALQHYVCKKEAKKNALPQSSGADMINNDVDCDTAAESVHRIVNAIANASVVATENPPSADGDIEHQPCGGDQIESTDIDAGQTSHNPQFLEEIAHDGRMVANIYADNAHDTKALIRMSIFAGIAIAFHNFPEGLATFVSTLHSAKVGASVAVAIGIHNIPEGICVAMPIFYATNSRRKAFFWATLSGLTEPIGAFLGWLVLRKVFTQVVYGILFGVVSGMMIYISVKELLPTAHKYDRDDKVTTAGLIFGMLVMAASLVLFKF